MGNRMIQKIKNKLSLKAVLFIILGGMAGFAYYYFIGCTGNACPITGNPYISTGYGMAAGLLIGWESKKEKKND